MAASRAIEEEIRANRRAIARLKREIFGIDKTHKSRYIREFHSEFRSYDATATSEEVIAEASRRDIVYFGDYHPLTASQDWVLRLMEELPARGRKVVLALEMLYVHQQDSLDRWMKGKISEAQFLEAIDYRSEWGFDWKSYRRIFERAKDPFIPIFGIDSEHRDNLKYIRRRDRLAARRIGTIRKFFPDHLILVVVGESHVASAHLPAAVRSELGGSGRDLIIVQNIDEIYWRLLAEGLENVEAVKIDAERYCVFTSFPMLKYQAYREIIDVWMDGEEVDAVTPFFHETIEELHAFLAPRARKQEIELANGRREALETVLPEVQSRSTYHAFSAHLRARRAGPREIMTILEHLKYDGMRYVPELNTLLIVKNEPSRLVREAARFVLHLMRGAIMERREKRLAPVDAFYGTAVEEALVCYAANIVNPSLNCVREDPLLGSLDGHGSVARAAPRRSMRETKILVGAVRRLSELESAASPAAREGTVDTSISSLGPKRRVLVAKALGARLGEALHSSYRAGRVTKDEMARFFSARVNEPGSPSALYLRLVDAALGRGSGSKNGAKRRFDGSQSL